MTMEKQPFENASPIENSDIPMSCKFSGGEPANPYLLFSLGGQIPRLEDHLTSQRNKSGVNETNCATMVP